MSITHLTGLLGTDTEAWAQGNVDLVDQIPYAIAVTGSRASTSYGQSVASDVANWLTGAGHRVINGGAYGIDAAVLASALAAGAAPIVVTAAGVDVSHPSGNRQLLEDILGRGGLVLSLERPGSQPSRQALHRRSKWIGATSAGTIVVEASTRSAALLTAQAADQADKYIAAVPGPITSAASAGANGLIAGPAGWVITDQESALAYSRVVVDVATSRNRGNHAVD